MSTKGMVLQPAAAAALSLDGTLVYVEGVEPTFASVVALPEQPATRTDTPVFTPGRVGAKKISPFATAEEIIPLDQLSERNRAFIDALPALRAAHGPNYIDRTAEELAAAAQATSAPKEKKARVKKDKPAKPPLCVTCDQQRGHPNHPGDHEFEAPKGKEPKVKEPKPPREKKAPREKKVRVKRGALPEGALFAWTSDADARLAMLQAVNPKYQDGNSGFALVELIRAAGAAGIDVPNAVATMAKHEKWARITPERITHAFGQLYAGKLIAEVTA